jgi:hypothetical protein
VAVGIQAEAQERRLAFSFAAGICHQPKLPAVFQPVKPGCFPAKNIFKINPS